MERKEKDVEWVRCDGVDAQGGIDWEARRYEIAKEIYPMVCHDMDRLADKCAPARAAVELADILIAELLKKGGDDEACL